jgi:hypothetical protein
MTNSLVHILEYVLMIFFANIFRINSVIDIVPKLNAFKVDLHLRLKWIDPRLKFTQIISEDSLLLNPDLVWKPDVYFFNEAGKPEILDRSLRLKQNGEITWNRHFIISLNSAFGVHDYPFDSQELDFVLMSYANSQKTMNLRYFESGPVYPSVAKNIQFSTRLGSCQT